MTALDTPVPARTLRAARREAERAAQLFVRSVRRARWLTAAGAATGLTAGVAGMLVGSAWLLVGLPLLVLSLAVAWTLTDARRRPTRAAPGVALDPLTEPALHKHLAGLARELGVPGPSEVRLVPEAHIGIDLCTQRPVLRLGAPLLWHLDLAELDRLAAGPLAQLHAVVAPEVRPGLAVATRLDSARFADDTTPLAGALVRRLGRRLDARQRSLLAAVREWAEAAVPRTFRPTPADRSEHCALREVDEIEAVRRQAAADAGVGLRSLAAGSLATLAGCEQVGALAPRPDHAVVRPAVSLLSDPDGLDRRLSERVAAQDGLSSTLVERHELPYRVWLPSWRRERDRGLPVVVHLTGSWPRTLQELFGVLAPGPLQRWSGSDPVDPVPLLGALLSGRPQRLFAGAQPAPHERGDTGHLEREADRDGAGDPVRHEAVVRLVAAAVRVAAVEQRRFTLGWHDVWGAQLLDAEGAAAPLEAFVGDAVARRDVGALTEWLAEVGVAIDVAWERAEPPPGGLDALPITAFAARQGARGVDAVVLDGWLLGYPHPSRTRLRGLLGRGCASDTAELLTLARTHRDSLVDVADPAASARLADVTSARLESATGRGWTLCLELPDRRLDLAGDGPVGPVAATLTGALGGRLACGGAAAPGSPGRAWPAVLLGSMATVAAALTMVTAVLAALGWGPTGLVPGDGPLDRVVAVLALGSVPVLLLRLAGAETARAMGRRGPDPRGPAGRVPPAGWVSRPGGVRSR